MTCQACQTWNGDEEHRCRRCGRRLRATPTRHVREAYPIAATALAYQPAADTGELETPDGSATIRELAGQQPLFSTSNEPRVIPFEKLTSRAERESIRARAAQLNHPGPVRSAKVEVWGRPRRSQARSGEQQQFDFSNETVMAAPESSIQCGAPVAPPALRLGAALVDGFVVLFAAFLALVTFRFATGTLPSGKLALSAYLTCYFALALTYKLIWCAADRDTVGMKAARLRLVDLDGNPASQRRRFWRALSAFLSFGAAGLGLIWTFADADGLAWHDHISATFPTFAEE